MDHPKRFAKGHKDRPEFRRRNVVRAKRDRQKLTTIEIASELCMFQNLPEAREVRLR